MPEALRLRPTVAPPPQLPEGRARRVAELPADSHVHTEWSWDALRGGAFERVLGSLHSVNSGGERWVVDDLTGPAAPPGLDRRFEEEFRAVLSALAASERAQELNTTAARMACVSAWRCGAG